MGGQRVNWVPRSFWIQISAKVVLGCLGMQQHSQEGIVCGLEACWCDLYVQPQLNGGVPGR